MQKFYCPSDPKSSPFDPVMGATVIYRSPRQAFDDVPQSFPAIVIKTYDDDKCDLVVFTSIGTRYIRSVPFSSDETVVHSWKWPEEITQRLQKETKTNAVTQVA